jgi:hypothetical protein
MRTTIVIDDHLMREAFCVTGLKTKREVVDLALRTLLRRSAQSRNPSFPRKIALGRRSRRNEERPMIVLTLYRRSSAFIGGSIFL